MYMYKCAPSPRPDAWPWMFEPNLNWLNFCLIWGGPPFWDVPFMAQLTIFTFYPPRSQPRSYGPLCTWCSPIRCPCQSTYQPLSQKNQTSHIIGCPKKNHNIGFWWANPLFPFIGLSTDAMQNFRALPQLLTIPLAPFCLYSNFIR